MVLPVIDQNWRSFSILQVFLIQISQVFFINYFYYLFYYFVTFMNSAFI